jgi:hypothetical protein
LLNHNSQVIIYKIRIKNVNLEVHPSVLWKKAGKLWKKETAEGKGPFFDMERRDQQRYDEEMAPLGQVRKVHLVRKFVCEYSYCLGQN